jgi:tetratricopeptide (TPR) repeat protein
VRAVAFAVFITAFVPASVLAFELKDCEQQDSSPLALRACSDILKSGQLDQAAIARVYLRRGLAWMIEDEPAEAVADSTRALEIAPKNIKALTSRARANAVLGNHAAAVQDWTALIELKPEPADLEALYLERGASQLGAGDPQAALADYDKTLQLNPRSVKAHVGRAGVYVSLNDREMVLKECSLARAIDPNDSAPYFELGDAAERWGDKKLAIENFTAALKMNPRGFWNARKALKRLGVDNPP